MWKHATPVMSTQTDGDDANSSVLSTSCQVHTFVTCTVLYMSPHTAATSAPTVQWGTQTGHFVADFQGFAGMTPESI
eukprot:m.779688 g.779688  ORF g.779688 m.779688 type:complete len:77 (+) comp23279_c0_seq6:3345-3575(+)